MEQHENGIFLTPSPFHMALPNLLFEENITRYSNYGIPLYQAALKGDWEAMLQIIEIYPEGAAAGITRHGDTALHIAAVARRTEFVEKLVSLMTPTQLLIQNGKGNTALCFAAISGTVPIAKAMIQRSGPLDRKLANMRGNAGSTPLYMAALLGHRDMVNYLLPYTDLCDQDHINLLISTINADFYDVALRICQCRKLAVARNGDELTLLHILARKSGKCRQTQLGFWRRFRNLLFCTKSLPPKALELVELLWKEVIQNHPKCVIYKQIRQPTNLIFEAAKAGNVEFLTILIRSYPDLIWELDNNCKTIFHVAVEYRQAKVFRLIHDIGAMKELLTFYTDEGHNTILHLAAKQPSPDILNAISGPAFQMQREIQWFKVVESILHPQLIEAPNLKGKTARALFINEHEELRKKGEKWMRISAASYSLVATLIVTMVFGAASKLLADREINFNNLKYLMFAIFEAVSLVYSTASILLFLSVMTSRYAEEDFLKSLPRKLCIGLISLVFAIVAMMLAFFTIFYINFKRRFFLYTLALGVPGLLFIVYYLFKDSFLLVFRLMAGRNILFKPLRNRLF